MSERPGPERAVMARDDGSRPSYPISVLSVDDHAVFADALRHRLLLEPDLYPVWVAYDAGSALDVVRRHRVDVAILDYALQEDGSGLSLAEMINRDSPYTRMIMLSALDSVPAAAETIAAGARAWLPKSVEAGYVVRTIHGVYAGEMWLDPALLAQVMPHLSAHAAERARSPLAALTSREREVLDRIIDGSSRTQIARQLGIAPDTVRTHIQRLLAKLEAHSMLEAVTTATRLGAGTDRAPRATVSGGRGGGGNRTR